jgi:hypothetical protein
VKTYLLAFNPHAGNFTITQLFAFISDNKKIYQYYTPFVGCYILKSSYDLTVVQNTLRGFFETAQFVVSEINPFSTGGALPAEIWPWVNNGLLPSLPASK